MISCQWKCNSHLWAVEREHLWFEPKDLDWFSLFWSLEWPGCSFHLRTLACCLNTSQPPFPYKNSPVKPFFLIFLKFIFPFSNPFSLHAESIQNLCLTGLKHLSSSFMIWNDSCPVVIAGDGMNYFFRLTLLHLVPFLSSLTQPLHP